MIAWAIKFTIESFLISLTSSYLLTINVLIDHTIYSLALSFFLHSLVLLLPHLWLSSLPTSFHLLLHLSSTLLTKVPFLNHILPGTILTKWSKELAMGKNATDLKWYLIVLLVISVNKIVRGR